MSDQSPLIVPIELKALAVNRLVRNSTGFHRWSLNYHSLHQFSSPEPAPFSGYDPDFVRLSNSDGIYLHWTLPDALRNGSQSGGNGTTQWPLVPNRWLVVRYSGPLNARLADAWVVESDHLSDQDGTSPYLDPNASVATPTLIGRKLDLGSGGYQDTGSGSLFLTAVAPGEPTFAAYQPYVENVFSLHDTLEGVADSDTLSYMVLGWFSSSSADILADWDGESFSDYLSSLGWMVTGDSGSTAGSSVYSGMVLDIDWERENPIPSAQNPVDPQAVGVAIGNTAIDALTALIQAQSDELGLDLDARLLEAFQYDLLNILDQPDGPEIVEQKIHEAWFRSYQGGYRWDVVQAQIGNPGDLSDQAEPTPAELESEAVWLATLNQNQAAYDAGMRELNALQWQLYMIWWKQGKANTLYPYPFGLSASWFQNQLNEANPSGILAQVIAQQNAVNALLAQIPHGNSQEALSQSISDWLDSNGIVLPATRELKQYALENFSQTNDPVILISGVKANGMLNSNGDLPCRFPDQLVYGFNYNGSPITASSMSGHIPTIALGGLPAPTQNLINEFFFLDPANATMVANYALYTTSSSTVTAITDAMSDHDNALGTLPAVDLSPWEQPWSPLYMMWEMDYYPIDYETGGVPNWSFDGEKYAWKGTGVQDFIPGISGRIFLTPQSSFNFQSQLTKYLQSHPDANLEALEAFIESIDDWDFLSQTLDGFSALLGGRNPLSNVGPGNSTVGDNLSLADLVGANATYAPITGAAQPEPFVGFAPSDFQAMRGGQFIIRRLMVVDRFGQFVELVTYQTSEHRHPILAYGMVPDVDMDVMDPERFAQLPPRLLQPARLDFDYVAADGSNRIVDLEAGVNPVAAWVLPNHPNHSLAFYGPTGSSLGEMQVTVDRNGNETLTWSVTPGSSYGSLGALQFDFPILYDFLNGLQTHGGGGESAVAAFRNLVQVVDETLWAIDPLGPRDDLGLSVLVGRPLALVRSMLKFRLSGPAIQDPSWQYTLNPPENPMLDYEFPIRLGDLAMSQDGLIGYFLEDDYDNFFSTHYPSPGQIAPANPPYITQTAPSNYPTQNFRDTTQTYLTMLVDPRASVHAFSGILPVTRLSLPAKFIAGGLSAMDVTFRVGPLLSTLLTPGDGDNIAIKMPAPSERSGTWAWLSKDATRNSVEYELSPSDQSADLSNVPSVLRNGLLVLRNAMGSNE